jgi:hypothetical protein
MLHDACKVFFLWEKSIKYGFTKFQVTNQEGVMAKNQ